MLRIIADFLLGRLRGAKCTLLGAPPRSSHWPAVRAAHLREHPTCAACGTREKLEVHHVRPYHLCPARELDPTNLITLCEGPRKHHLILGHRGNWQDCNPHVRRDAAAELRRLRDAGQI